VGQPGVSARVSVRHAVVTRPGGHQIPVLYVWSHGLARTLPCKVRYPGPNAPSLGVIHQRFLQRTTVLSRDYRTRYKP
jgi:hypothetical protein